MLILKSRRKKKLPRQSATKTNVVPTSLSAGGGGGGGWVFPFRFFSIFFFFFSLSIFALSHPSQKILITTNNS